ncbi:GNAT family N-acetyltransferase [Aerosakkonemataceae cyanobacterium BLCC-F154]|uniref:GNAT family N-acetyltransferase n=1 Tax=Floridaenema fluviatile BLCC-F154 TaxID=3153640 RepID=A0ABV4Y5I2_9CYAN
MVYIPSELPEGFRIRRLRFTDRDRLSLYLIPRNPEYILSILPIKLMLTLCKIRHGIVLAIIPSIGLYVVTIIMVSSLSVNWLWIGLIWLIILGICIRFALTRREDWLRFCWVVEQQGRFIAYGALHPYNNYSVIEVLQVYPKWARKGIGARLVKTMIEQAPKPVYVNSAVRVVGFYARLGFRKIRLKELPSEVQNHFNFKGVATLLVYE